LRDEKHLFTHYFHPLDSVNSLTAPSDQMLSATRHIRSSSVAVLALGVALAYSTLAEPVQAQSLRGSTSSLDRQNRVARAHDYTYIDTPQRLRFFADRGWLVPVTPTRDYTLHAVSFPYARPEVELFVRRLGAQYRRGCGEQLVVTSLTRPATRQPRNASDRSVHPTGMAMDLRYSWNRTCRRWLEDVLTSLERQGVLEATLERSPRHYHVALFPQQYASYVETLAARMAATVPETTEYQVRSGDSLWAIARRHGTTVDELRDANGLDGERIFVGQVLDVPVGT
jgi:hypothetical protein